MNRLQEDADMDKLQDLSCRLTAAVFDRQWDNLKEVLTTTDPNQDLSSGLIVLRGAYWARGFVAKEYREFGRKLFALMEEAGEPLDEYFIPELIEFVRGT